jgi:hypothetical protein
MFSSTSAGARKRWCLWVPCVCGCLRFPGGPYSQQQGVELYNHLWDPKGPTLTLLLSVINWLTRSRRKEEGDLDEERSSAAGAKPGPAGPQKSLWLTSYSQGIKALVGKEREYGGGGQIRAEGNTLLALRVL